MTEYASIFISFITALGGLEFIKYMLNRKANKRKASAEAETLENNNEHKEVDRLDSRLRERDAKIDSLYLELRVEQKANIELMKQNHELDLQIKVGDITRCEKRGCMDRTPPSGY